MTPQELRDLIEGDQQANDLRLAGDVAGCAARCSAIAPPLLREHFIAELGVLAAYPNPQDAMTVLGTIKTIAESGQNPLIEIIYAWMKPGSPGIDIGNATARAMLTAPVQSGGLGLSAELAAPLLSLGERPQVFTINDVKKAFDDSTLVVGQVVRVLSPFSSQFPDTYPIDYIYPDGTCIIAGDRSFVPQYLEAV